MSLSPAEIPMPLHAQTTHDEIEDADASKAGASGPFETDGGAGAIAAGDSAETSDAVTIELDFKAFADNVPPTEHARRAVSYSDPTLQDFADQALEVAALRAELKRLNRDYGALQHAVRLRDMRLQSMREQLDSARARSRDPAPQPENLPEPARTTEGAVRADDRSATQAEARPEREASASNEASNAHELSSTLDLSPTLNLSDSAAVPKTPAPNKESQVVPRASQRQLIPVDHEGEAVPLCRDIMTIGRAATNDICISSRAVSRDHARLLMSPRSVTVFDMDSANGCFVNDKPVKRQKLQDGDILRIGDRSYRFAGNPESQDLRRSVDGCGSSSAASFSVC